MVTPPFPPSSGPAERRGEPSFHERFGAALRAARHAAGLTLIDVEVRTRRIYKSASVAAYERGERRCSVERAHGLAVFYGTTIDALLASALPGEDAPPHADGLNLDEAG